MFVLMAFMLLISFLFIFSNHPVSGTLIVLFQSAMVSLLITFAFKLYLMSYIIILSYVSGMMVIFSYTLFLSPNPSVMMNFKFKYILILIYVEIVNYYDMKVLMFDMKNYFNNLYLWSSGVGLIFSLLILFMSMLSSMKMIYKYMGLIKHM
uniref:NADH dehydrogenase subunit 6 n=1 Tax=Sacculina sp. 'Beibu Gulf' TaxID=2861897 RepID=A0A8F9W8T3_9CRUS|nr:NADH dehydrogenase subunit 6 [Sacculina sp. 'Beibu Gulf']